MFKGAIMAQQYIFFYSTAKNERLEVEPQIYSWTKQKKIMCGKAPCRQRGRNPTGE